MREHKILNLQETCTGCFACMNVCPKDAITLPEKFEGFYYPEIDKDRCIDCSLCDKVCPQITKQPTTTMRKAYYGWAKDDVVRKASSSGGMFHILAADVINNGGVVYGASFNYDGIIRLECHSTRQVPIVDLQKSKYVQNYVGLAFREIKKDLQTGNPVLFCGTPCQAAGLRSFLREVYPNMIVVDFICHGVPSMSLLRLHLEYLGIKNIKTIDFRPKNRAWVDDLDIYFFKKQSARPTEIQLYRTPWSFDEYFYMFETYKSTRRSCRSCNYCNGQRSADITLADFWGIKKYKPEEFDTKGISLVISNTKFGDSIIDRLSVGHDAIMKPLPLEYAAYVYERVRTSHDSPYQNSLRDKILEEIYSIGYKPTLIKYRLKVRKMTLLRNCIHTYLSNIKHKLLHH